MYSFENFLVAHANIYIVADKYQVYGLKRAVTKKMKDLVDNHMDFSSLCVEPGIGGFIRALRVIITNTTANDDLARKVMVEACVRNLNYLHQEPQLQSLLMESAELGAAIIGHQSLWFGLAGAWVCQEDITHNASIECMSCEAHFEEEMAWQNRYEEEWTCSECGHKGPPGCAYCGFEVEWVDRKLLPERV